MLLLAGLAGAQPATAALTLTEVGTFVRPVYVTAPPGDRERLMVVLRDGDIRVVKNGTTLAQPFLSISDVDSASGPGFEGGLLSMAFSPDYLTSGRFYVYMVADDANPGASPYGPIEIREYRRSAADPEKADPLTKRTVLTIPHAANSNHYGGTINFGPDGLLYASVGDGGGSDDPDGNGQNTSTRLGKLLRFDPRQEGSAQLRVPADNPFASGGGDALVYSYGLRNPFRFSFDRQNGDLTIGDVGQNKFEEIDFAPHGWGRGANFGWDACEGLFGHPDETQPCTTGALPVHAYPNPDDGCAVTGGVVVRDPGLEELAGKYLYGDFCRTYVKSLQLGTPAATNETTLSVTVPANRLVAFGEDACGRIHLVLQASGGSPTQVQRLEDESPSSCGPVGPSPPGGGQAAPERAPIPAFAFTLAGALRQRPLLSGNVGVRVRCGAACVVRGLGRLSLRIRSKRIHLRQALGRRSSAGTVRLRLRLPAKARKPLRRALRKRALVRAALTVRVRDSAGKLSIRQRMVRVAR